MDPIIRFAPMSPVARRVGRPAVPAASPAVTQHALPARAVVAAVQPVPPVAPVPPAPALAVPDYAAELALAQGQHQGELQQREAQITALRKAAQETALGLRDAYVDAERRGYAAGEVKGEKTARDALRVQIDRVGALATQIAGARADLMASSEDTVVDTVFTAVCRIIGEQGASRAAVQAVVRDITAAARVREHLTVRLHPDDAVLFRDGAGEDMRIMPDPSVTLGGCIVDSAAGSLDARFETQLDLLGAALKAARTARRPQQDGA